MDQACLLEIQHLFVKYPCGKAVLQDVSLRLQKREILCVIGESGSGKSTLLQAILRMPGKVEITRGEILFAGQDLCALKGEAMRNVRGKGIGMVFQEPGASLNPVRKIGTQFYETLRAQGPISRRQADEKARSLLNCLDLADPEHILRSYPVQLSGGMNQRVAIALAMALEPEVLLADEPTSALDVTVQVQIVAELLKLREQFGTGILVVTHNMGVVAKIADTVAVMAGGKIVEYGSRDQVLGSPSHTYTQSLLAAVPKLVRTCHA
ncbi:MAG: ABC transporter ATP-binding protein [Clostridia bacterium]|nr:ABC transporter ATP-binding protein [Clostridia bacterium]NCC75851.1 ABC transporter ATP-binding protein [Clostridia bacterium]